MPNKTKVPKIVEKIRKSSEHIVCTECGEPYVPASGHADIRCANCGNHQNLMLHI